MTNDKALEAAKWPEPPEAVWVWGKYRKYAETYCDPNEINQAEFEVPVTKYIRADLAVVAPLSTLPGEAEVVGWLVSTPGVDPFAVTGEKIANYGVVQGWDVKSLVTLISYQAMQARALAAEASRDAADNALVDKYRNPKTGHFSFPGDVAAIVRRIEAAEARVKELEGALRPFASEVTAKWADENGWTASACQNDRICDWFGPSDFYRTALTRTGGSNG